MKEKKMFLDIFPEKKPIIAMLHLKGKTKEQRLDTALRESDIYIENGVDALIVEDYYGDEKDVEAVLKLLRQKRPEYILGVNVLDNFPLSYEYSVEYGAPFMQVDSVCGHLPVEEDKAYAGMIEGYRSKGNVAVIGGVQFKYQKYLSGRSLEEDLNLGMLRCDAIAVTGDGTGQETDDQKIKEFRRICKDFPLVVGAGMTKETVPAKLGICDAAIVGSYFKDTRKDTGDVFGPHVKEFMDEVKKLR
ncbi:MAG: membrane biogenesis protein [Ruminococcaceae bacterium]|nr:membrane biogenesis protein [Oscillospiraceae bacterium]